MNITRVEVKSPGQNLISGCQVELARYQSYSKFRMSINYNFVTYQRIVYNRNYSKLGISVSFYKHAGKRKEFPDRKELKKCCPENSIKLGLKNVLSIRDLARNGITV
ncbi:MAG: hypothetical protein HOP11_04235 [Saprospiraceae bacterium]|nr:hypothetical protein [Saprospiraceae bacterium]